LQQTLTAQNWQTEQNRRISAELIGRLAYGIEVMAQQNLATLDKAKMDAVGVTELMGILGHRRDFGGQASGDKCPP
jgi:hypothetical protein